MRSRSPRTAGSPMPRLVEYAEAPLEVRAVFDDIKQTRGVPDVNNFWKALAVHPPTLARTWASLKEVWRRAPGPADQGDALPLAASMAAGCAYCTASHTAAARAKGMTEAMRGELLAVVGMAAETNRLTDALRVPVDPALDEG
jgi:AhpD family alkylhydroperoxidase